MFYDNYYKYIKNKKFIINWIIITQIIIERFLTNFYTILFIYKVLYYTSFWNYFIRFVTFYYLNNKIRVESNIKVVFTKDYL